MPYSREKFSSSWLVLWTVLFFGGMIAIFSFLLGNPFFSGEITGKYIFSASNSSLFVNGEFVGKDAAEGNILLGKRELCAIEYGKTSKCEDGEIRSNAFSILKKKDVTLLARSKRVDILTSQKAYFDPLGNGVFWIDEEKNVAWLLSSGENRLHSVRLPASLLLTKDVFSVQYKEGKKIFEVSNGHSSLVEVSFPEDLISFDSVRGLLMEKEQDLLLSSTHFLKKSEEKELLFASFSHSIENIQRFSSLRILDFSASIWGFDTVSHSFFKICEKDESTPVFFHQETASLLFVKNGNLNRLYLK